MAPPPSTVIKLKRSETLNTIPTTANIEVGEVAVNTADKKIYIRDSSDNIVAVADKNITYSKYNSNTTITSNTGVIADTSAGSFTITMPASPVTGDKIEIVDGSGTFGTNPLTVARNGNKIADIADDLSLNITGAAASFIYNTDTWEVYVQIGSNSGGSVTLSGAQTFTNKTISGSSNTLSNIGNSSLTNNSITVNDTSVSLGGSVTVSSISGNAGTVTNGVYTTDTSTVTNTMLAGSITNDKLINSSFTLADDSSSTTNISLGETLKIAGGSGVDTTISGDTITISLENTVVTESSSDVLTNKTISGSSNTLSNIDNSSLTNSSITLVDESSSTTNISLGETLKITGGSGIDTTISGDTLTVAISEGPAFSAYANSSTQTITSGSQQKVLFQTEEFDTNNNYANSTFTPTVAGYYQLNAEVRLDGASGTGEIMIVIWKNGSEYKRGTNQSGTQIASSFWAMQVSSLVYANGSTDYFEIYVQQTSGGNLTVTAVNSPNITWFNGCKIRGV